MPWTTPSYEEIAMSAEIGAYQEDFGPEEQRFAQPAGDVEESDGDQ